MADRAQRTWAPALLVGAFFLALAMQPASAAAAQSCHRRATNTYEIQLRGSHGYELEFQSFRSGKAQLTVEATDRRSAIEPLVEYAVNGHSGPHGFEADFGRLGRIEVHFRRPQRQIFPTESVEFQGTIDFHGEEGFTSVSRDRARGSVSRQTARVCPKAMDGGSGRASRSPAARRAEPRLLTTIAAEERAPNRRLALGLRTSAPPFTEEEQGDFAIATLEERRERIHILRAVIVDPLFNTAVASTPGAGAVNGTLTLPPPFSGTASYSHGPGTITSWSGDLTVSLPGAANLPLTGPGFTAVACSGKAETKSQEECSDEGRALPNASPLFHWAL